MRIRNTTAMVIVAVSCMYYVMESQEPPPVPEASQNPISPAGPPVDDSASGTFIQQKVIAPLTIQWVSLQEAKKGSLPIWVHFTADGNWCVPCEQLTLETTTDVDIVKISRRFNCVLLKYPGRIAERWKVSGVPYDYFITPDFKVRYRGTTPVANFSGYLERQAMKFKEYWK